MEFINNAASKLLSLCSGELTIGEIVEKIYGQGSLEKVPIPILSFFYEAKKRGHIELSKEKSECQKLTITGSFDFYVPIHISIELTSQCNLEYTYCYNEFADIQNELTPLELILILDEWKQYGLMGVELTGGEPFLYQGFWDVLDYCSQNFKRVGLLTNGTLINEKVAKKLGQYKDRIIISVSLDGSCPEVHETLRGKGSFYKTVKAIRYLWEAGLPVRVGMSVTSSNIFDLENTIKLARNLGAKYFSWAPIAPFGKGEELAWKWDASKAKAIYDLEMKMIEKYKGFVTVIPKEARFLFEKLGNCGFGYKNVALAPSGKIRPCLFLPETDPISDLKKYPLENVFRNPIFQFFRDLKAPSEELCKGCKYLAYCGTCIVRPLKAIEREGRLCVWAKTYHIDDWLTRYQKYKFDPQNPNFQWK